MGDARIAVIFDLDGVLVDTVELHFQGWAAIAAELRIPFDRRHNDRFRGRSRVDCLNLLLSESAAQLSLAQQNDLIERKNRDLLARVSQLTPADMLSGGRGLLLDLRARRMPVGLASSSRNARVILDQLDALHFFDVIVDGNDVPASKPDPAVYVAAAAGLGCAPQRCVAIEDGAAGIQAARAAGMRVIGVGKAELVGEADWCAASPAELSVDRIRQTVI